ncbi:LysR family transcriptional regulator [Silvimonas iriomotensis]|uniref:LysR family transcriptional regulator n=1 Tax=Silvimonas iriomotensis TaxID=449662 RepID=A0ABQ2P642_9NEIS|nr:LysR family transcriptional regulator [Silvimonas iriomotensis]GGP19046.1 LysR family transcriptional regulator [Silvimonas iriomotensis]
MNITLRQLRAFLAVAHHGGFTEAARELSLTQSALSLLVKDLETEIGFKLFDRTTRRVALSQPGAEFLPAARQIFDDLQSAVRSASDLATLEKGQVRACAPQVLACTLLAPVIARYQLDHPKVQLKLVDTLLEDMLEQVVSGEVDFAVGPDRKNDAHLVRTPLFCSPFAAWCRAGHPLAGSGQTSWAQLQQWPLIIMESDFSSRLLPELQGAHPGLQLAPAWTVAYVTSGLGLAGAGLGVVIAPDYVAPLAGAFGLQRIALVEPALSREISVYRRPDRSLSPAAARFLEVLTQVATENP